MNEALNRLKLKMFEKWLDAKDVRITNEEKTELANGVSRLRHLLLDTDSHGGVENERQPVVSDYIRHSAHFNELMHNFTVEGRLISYILILR